MWQAQNELEKGQQKGKGKGKPSDPKGQPKGKGKGKYVQQGWQGRQWNDNAARWVAGATWAAQPWGANGQQFVIPVLAFQNVFLLMLIALLLFLAYRLMHRFLDIIERRAERQRNVVDIEAPRPQTPRSPAESGSSRIEPRPSAKQAARSRGPPKGYGKGAQPKGKGKGRFVYPGDAPTTRPAWMSWSLWNILTRLNQGQSIRGDAPFAPLLSASVQQQIVFWSSLHGEAVGENEEDGNLLPPAQLHEIIQEIARLDGIHLAQMQATRDAWNANAPERDAEPDHEATPHPMPAASDTDVQSYESFVEYGLFGRGFVLNADDIISIGAIVRSAGGQLIRVLSANGSIEEVFFKRHLYDPWLRHG